MQSPFEIQGLTEGEFIGIILPDLDPKQQGRYKVHMPELMQHIAEDQGIWCKNQVNSWSITGSDVGEFGSYYPLQPGINVIVKFYKNDLNTGYIDRVIGDASEKTDTEAQDCIAEKPTLEDRDEQYIIFKTPKKFNVFYVNEDTQNEPNTIYLVYNRDGEPERRTVYRIDESGMHLWTRDNRRVRILLDENRQIDGNQTELIKKNRTHNIGEHDSLAVRGDKYTTVVGEEHRTVNDVRTTNIMKTDDLLIKEDRIANIEGSDDLLVKSDMTIEVQGQCNISVKGTCNIKSESQINLEGSTVNVAGGSINLNCGTSVSSKKAKTSQPADSAMGKTFVRDLGPAETEEYDDPDAVGEKCDDATKKE